MDKQSYEQNDSYSVSECVVKGMDNSALSQRHRVKAKFNKTSVNC